MTFLSGPRLLAITNVVCCNFIDGVDTVVVLQKFSSAIINGLIQLMNDVHPKIQHPSSLDWKQGTALALECFLDDGVSILASRPAEVETIVDAV